MVGRSQRRFWLYASLAALGLGAPGCSGNVSEMAPQAVAGTVTLDGRPLKSGTINLFPYGEGNAFKTISASELISNGRFLIPRAKGLVPAKYRIAVYGGMDVSRPSPEISAEEAAADPKDILPARYNVDTELEVEIKPGSIKELRIEIDSK